MQLKYRLQYTGEDADQNYLPAHQGTQSLEGMAWAFTVLSNYLASGSLKRRGRLDERIRVYVAPARRGSFINDIIIFVSEPNNLFVTSVLGVYAVNTLGSALNTFIVSAFRQVCGELGKPTERERSWMDRFPSGDLEATLDAIEPSVKRGHAVIDQGASKLTIKRNTTPVLVMDRHTKAYVNANIEGDEIIDRSASIGALNVNSGNGRAYLPEVGKTVPFSVVKEPDLGTYQTLSRSLDRYARGLPSQVDIRCREIFAHDGRIKKLIVFGASDT